jgi:hypothetical protein
MKGLTLRAIKIPGPKSPDLRAGVFQCARLKLTFGCLCRNRAETVGEGFISSLEMTRRYCNMTTQDLQAVHERVSLLSRS